MLVDSHAHLNFAAFKDDLNDVISRCQQQKMKVINIGSQLQTSEEAIRIAKDFDGFFASVGIHPIHLGESQLDQLETQSHQSLKDMSQEELLDELSKLISQPKVVAVGEIGLDYFRLTGDIEKTKQLQREYFIELIELAQKNNLPVILHCRNSEDNSQNAYDDVLKIIKNYDNFRGVIHCFGSTLKTAQEFIGAGCSVGFTGIITFKKKSEQLQEIVKILPQDKILIETDSPYLTPEPFRGQRNEPIYVYYVAKKIAELKQLPVEEVIEATADNARRLFNI